MLNVYLKICYYFFYVFIKYRLLGKYIIKIWCNEFSILVFGFNIDSICLFMFFNNWFIEYSC